MKIIMFFSIMFAYITATFSQTSLPFYEDWDYDGGFETHGWTFEPSQGEWKITGGIISSGFMNAANYSGEQTITNYDYALVSPVLDKGTASSITLQYDLEFETGYIGNQESLKYLAVEIRDSIDQESTWTTIKTFKAKDSILVDVKSNTNSIDITDYITTRQFQLRFRAYGSELPPACGWSIDNIAVTDENSPQPDGTLTVEVKDMSSGLSMEGAIVNVADSAATIAISDTTNYLGMVIFNLPPGLYNVTCTMNDYNDYSYDSIPLESFDEMEFTAIMKPLPAKMAPLEPIKYEQTHMNDQNWSDEFGVLGIGGSVNDLEVKDGELYVSGEMLFAGSTRSRNVVKWTGKSWKDLDGGLNGESVMKLTHTENYIYAIGQIERNDGRNLGVVRWDGEKWNTLGMWFTPSDYFLSVAVDAENIYIGGDFNVEINGVSYTNLIYFDGANDVWNGFSGNIDGPIYSMSIHNNNLYVAGKFSKIGGVQANGVAKWDGVSWSALGNGIDITGFNCVFSVLATDSSVYAGGFFKMDGGINSIAQWDGTQWNNLDGGVIADEYDNIVYDMKYDMGKLYVGGQFDMAGPKKAGNIAVWDGSSWNNLGNGMNHGNVKSIAINNDDIYVGGNFHLVDSVFTWSVAKWDGVEWQALNDYNVNDAFSDITLAVESDGKDVYVGGAFTNIGNKDIIGLAKWDGVSWSDLGADLLPGSLIHAITIIDNEVYVGGKFSKIGGVQANGIAKWDGTKWNALGTGLTKDGSIFSIASYDGDIYVGGQFSEIGDITTYGIAKFNGVNWIKVDAGLNEVSSVTEILSHNHELYICGNLLDSEGSGVKKWNGEKWEIFADTDYEMVNTMAIFKDEFYIGGSFLTVNNNSIRDIAKYDGYKWIGPDARILPVYMGEKQINKLLAFNDELYVAGSFKSINDDEAMSHIAKWDGNEWRSIGSGIDASQLTYVRDIAISSDKRLNVVGKFDFAGPKPSNNYARYYDENFVFTNVTKADVVAPQVKLSNYPNPFKYTTTISYTISDAGNVTVDIYNIHGQKVRTLVNESQMPGTYQIFWNGTDSNKKSVKSGLYFYKLTIGSYSSTNLLVLM